jgi:hypothetical protein
VLLDAAEQRSEPRPRSPRHRRRRGRVARGYGPLRRPRSECDENPVHFVQHDRSVIDEGRPVIDEGRLDDDRGGHDDAGNDDDAGHDHDTDAVGRRDAGPVGARRVVRRIVGSAVCAS